jgi:pimeloyl-ACP methyl ester carboxylesterase
MLIVSLLSTMTAAQEKAPVIRDFSGTWSGKLKIQNMHLKLDMNIAVNAADSATVTFDSPDQGVLDLPTDKVMIDGDSLYVSLKAIGGRFSGKPDKAINSISGKWYQGGMSFPITMERQGQRTTLNRPQEPKPPFPYRVEEVTFPNTGAGFELAGTLTLPEKGGPFPVVILVSGSGPQNRDEELVGHKPFLVLADYLTRQGFAVLRYDDRGVGKSKGEFKTATTFDFATDAEAAMDFMKKHKDADTVNIGLIGHSEGGLIAPIVASRRKDLAFAVLMAGPGLTGEQILLLQSALISRAAGTDENSIKANQKISSDIYSVLKKNSDNEQAAKKIRALFAASDKKYAKDTSYHAMSEQEVNAQIETLTSPWFRCFLTLNPENYLSKTTCPVLAINGSLDLQVPPKENLQAIEKALIFGGNSSYVIEELPDLNHLFQTATTGSPSEYAKIEETIAPSVLVLVAKWIRNNLGT